MELSENAVCVVCKKRVSKCRGRDREAEFLWLRPDDSEVWLCHCQECWDSFNGVNGVANG